MASENKGRKPPTKKAVKKTSGNKNSSGRPWIVLGTLLLFIGTYFYFINGEEENEILEEQVPNYKLEKTGAGAHIDFTDKTIQIHRVVDQVLKENQATVLDTKQVIKTVKRQGIEGELKWTSRQLPVKLEKDKIDSLKKVLEKVLNKIGATVLQVAPDQYQGEAALRIDLGISDTLEGDQLTIIADQLYLLEKSVQITDKSPPVQSHKTKAKLALIIDDFGYTQAPIAAYAKISRPLTFAVLPNHPYSIEAAKEGANNGQQIILHLPMEAMSGKAKVEAQTINIDMSDGEIKALVNELTDSVPHLIGVNNHQGSKATSNKRVMTTVLNALAAKGLFFVDSKTISNSLAYDTAKWAGVPAAENQIFLDNDNEISAIKTQLLQAGDIALKNGSAVAIGHARVNTATAIEEIIPELEAKGIQLVFVSKLLN